MEDAMRTYDSLFSEGTGLLPFINRKYEYVKHGQQVRIN